MLLNLVTIAGTDSDANTNKNFGITAKYPALFYDHLSDVNASKKEGYQTKKLVLALWWKLVPGYSAVKPKFYLHSTTVFLWVNYQISDKKRY